MKLHRLISALTASALVGGGLVAAAAPTPAVAADVVRITPNPAYASAPFEGWGTSLVWFANATGGYPEDVRRDLLEKVFGEDGLDLNIARYNIGGGNATDVPPYLRPGGAVQGWWNPDLAASDDKGAITSTYADRDRYAAAWNPDDPNAFDWNADATQRWWIQALKDKITHWEAFSNSPPYFLTQSGYASGGFDANSEQLAPEDMDKFAGYLVKVVEHLEQTYGIQFSSLDPFNEPNTNYWGTDIGSNGWPTTRSRQEGAHIGPQNQDLMINALAARLAKESTTTDVPISAMDETNPSRFVADWNGWSAESKSLVDQLNVHTYSTGGRTAVRDIAKASDKPLWMSEVEGNWDSSGQGFNQTNIDNGIGMASHMIGDLRELEPSAWVFWQPVEDLYNMQKVEKTNWGSVFIDFDCNAEGNSARRIADGDADASCKVLTNAKYNTVRNFTHYIRPGDRLIPTDNGDTAAALGADGTHATLVHANSDSSARTVQIDLSGFGTIAPGAVVTPIVTTESPSSDVTANALVKGAPVAVDAAHRTATLTVPAKSVTTFVIDGVSGASASAATFAGDATYQLVGVQSGKALTAEGDALTIRSAATTAAQAAAQTWTVQSLSGAGTDRHRIALRGGDGRYLAGNGTSLTLVSADAARAASDPALQWIPSTTDGRAFSVLNVASERTLDVNGAATADGTSVGLWGSNDGANQLFTLAPVAIVSIDEVTAATAPGAAPTLPAQVTVRYAGGVTRSADVTWSTDGVDWSQSGVVTVTGQGTDVFGARFDTARATVEVGAYRATVPTSVTTFAGDGIDRVRAAAPATVPAEITTGGRTYDTPVVWDWSGLSDASFAAAGTVSVPGAAASNVSGAADLTATLTVILTPASERNVARDSVASATYTESGYPASRTINGSTSDKGWSNWRPGTLDAQDTLTYALAQTEQVRHVTAYFYRDGGTSWPRTLHVDHRTKDGSWVTGDTVDVPVPATGAPVVDVPLGDVSADEVRIVMDAYPDTHLIVSEVEIAAVAPSPASIADLARVTVGGSELALVAGKSDYAVTVPGAAWPTVSAVAVDRGATVSVVQPQDASGAAVITVVAADGSTTRTYRVDVTRVVTVEKPTVSGEFRAGKTVTASAPAVDPATAARAYQWERDGAAIPGATAATYGITDADAGHRIRVVVTASAEGLVSASAASDEAVAKPATAVASIVAGGSATNGWYTQPVFVAIQPPAGASAQYRVDDGTWRTYRVPFVVASNGSHVIEHRVVRAGAVVADSTERLEVKIDRTAPTISASRSPEKGDGTPLKPVTVSFAAADDLSGVARVEYSIDGGAWTADTGSGAVLNTVGWHFVLYRAVDTAGNSSIPRLVVVRIVADVFPAVAAPGVLVKGKQASVSATGFGSFTQVVVTVGDRRVASALTDQSGAATVRFVVPVTLPAGAATVRVVGAHGAEAGAAVTVR